MKTSEPKWNGEISDRELFRIFRSEMEDDASCYDAILEARAAFLFIQQCEKADLDEALYELMQNNT